MPKAKSQRTTTRKAPVNSKRGKSFDERVVARVGKRPVTRNQLAAKMGVKPQAVARPLGRATQQGKLVHTPKGFQKAI